MSSRSQVPPETRVEEPSGVAALGAAALDLAYGAKELYSVLIRTLYYTVRGKREPGAVVKQMHEIGNNSVFFVTVVMACIGLIGIYQTGTQSKRLIPDFTLMGAQYLQLTVRELAPTVGSLIIATRVGAGIAAEIGSMVVTEQVDALRMCAADPIDFLVKPRFIASIVMTTALVIWIATVMFFAGAVTAFSFFDVSFRTFFSFAMFVPGDLYVGLIKCVVYGAAIPVVSGYCGLSTFGGSEGVGWATTRAVVNSCLAVVILDLVISVPTFFLFPSK